MKVVVAGRDESEGLGGELSRAAGQRPDAGLASLMAGEADILRLGWRGTEHDYLARHVELMRIRHAVDAGDFAAPSRPGALGRVFGVVRRFLWRVLRYQHDWVLFRQGAVNAQLAHELALEHAERARQTADLERRVRALEERAARGEPAREPAP